MKSLSSAIIAASGVLCFTTGAFIAHSDTQIFVMLVGALVTLAGLIGWGLTLARKGD